MPDGMDSMQRPEKPKLAERHLIGPGLAIVASTYGLARYCFGLFVPEFERAFGADPALLGWIASGSYAGYMVAAVFASWMSGRVGPRLPVVLGGISAAIGMAMIAAAETPMMLALGVIVAGTSPGLAYPPLSDAVVRMVDTPRQNRTYTIINSGTSLGVLIAAPIALMAGEHWRAAWAVFAVLALATTLWNHRVLPSGPFPCRGGTLPKLRLRWFLKPGAPRLFMAALVAGLGTAVYWTFAVEMITMAAPGETHLGQIFWAVLGIAGFGGAIAGDVVSRLGLRRGLRLGTLIIAVSMALLAVAPGVLPAMMTSAAMFGMAFILITGMLGVWSINVFHDRPAAGFGATFLVITMGQMIAPALIGSSAGILGFPLLFLASAGMVMAIVFLVPGRDIRTMAAGSPATAAERQTAPRVGFPPRARAADVAVPNNQKPAEMEPADREPAAKEPAGRGQHLAAVEPSEPPILSKRLHAAR